MINRYARLYLPVFFCAATACNAGDLYEKLDQNLQKILPTVSPKNFEELGSNNFNLSSGEIGQFKSFNELNDLGSNDLNSLRSIESFRNLEMLNSASPVGGKMNVPSVTSVGPINPVGGIVPIAPSGAIQFNFIWSNTQYAALSPSETPPPIPNYISSKVDSLIGFIPVYRKHRLSIGCSAILKALGLQLIEVGNQKCDGGYVDSIKSFVSIYLSNNEREYFIEIKGPSERFIGKPGFSRDLFLVISSIDMNFDFGVITYSYSHHYASDVSSTYWKDVGSLEDKQINNFKMNIESMKQKIYSNISMDIESSLKESE